MPKTFALALLVAYALVAPTAAQSRTGSRRPVPVSTETLYESIQLTRFLLLADDAAARKGGTVRVQVTVSTGGIATSARAISGPAGLRKRAAEQARRVYFLPFEIDGVERVVSGVLIMHFTWDGRDSVETWLAMPNGDRWKRREAEDDIPSGVPGGVPGGVPSNSPGNVYAQPGMRRVPGGVLAGKAKEKPQPVYPQMAKAADVEGAVVVEVIVDETGAVMSARAVSGHPLLRDAAVQAARGWRFEPTVFEGVPVKVIGTITFNFRRAGGGPPPAR